MILALILGVATFFLASTRHRVPEEISSQLGTADVDFSSVQVGKTPFGIVWKYKGWLYSFIQNGQVVVRNIPIIVSLPIEAPNSHLDADSRYLVSARLTKTIHGKYVIKPEKNSSWIAKKQIFSLAEWRFSAKGIVKTHIQESIKNPHISAFLSGIATGEFDDRLLASELSRFGLQHLMAISGLHFSILSTLIAFSLTLLFSRQTAAVVTMALMSAYFIFLGVSPSVTRAWIAIIIGMAGFFFHRRHSALNALGLAALVLILYDPFVIEEIGFQFSFGITAAILIGFSPCDAFLQRLFTKRDLTIVAKADGWDRHAYCFLHWLRQSFALGLAVNSVALPLTLYHFHKFPLMSLVYNLFIPVLVSVSLSLLVFACFFHLMIPEIGKFLHGFNEAFTQFVLNFAFHLPKSFDWIWQVHDISYELIVCYLLALFCLGIFLNKWEEESLISSFE
jgi:competence protein ComEC